MRQPMFYDAFDNKVTSFERLELFQRTVVKKKPYLIFFTARSGSSFLTDLLRETAVAGYPGEFLNPHIIPGVLTGINKRQKVPVETSTDYLLWLLENRSTKNGAFGIKTTYLQYLPFIRTGLDRLFFSDFKLFYLYRNNVVKQAVSMYVAAETKLFHKNKELPDELISKANTLPYNSEKIRDWISHIWEQEKALESYFKGMKTDVQVLEYQQFSENPGEAVKTILRGIDVTSDVEIVESSYKKVRGNRNAILATEFLNDSENVQWLDDLGISGARLQGE